MILSRHRVYNNQNPVFTRTDRPPFYSEVPFARVQSAAPRSSPTYATASLEAQAGAQAAFSRESLLRRALNNCSKS